MSNIFLNQLGNGVQINFSGSSAGGSSSQTNFDFVSQLNSGAISQFINYPLVYTNPPTTTTCQFENNIDNYSYIYSLSNITISGFQVNFSDYLKASGYILLTNVIL